MRRKRGLEDVGKRMKTLFLLLLVPSYQPATLWNPPKVSITIGRITSHQASTPSLDKGIALIHMALEAAKEPKSKSEQSKFWHNEYCRIFRSCWSMILWKKA